MGGRQASPAQVGPPGAVACGVKALGEAAQPETAPLLACQGCLCVPQAHSVMSCKCTWVWDSLHLLPFKCPFHLLLKPQTQSHSAFLQFYGDFMAREAVSRLGARHKEWQHVCVRNAPHRKLSSLTSPFPGWAPRSHLPCPVPSLFSVDRQWSWKPGGRWGDRGYREGAVRGPRTPGSPLALSWCR